MLLIPAYAKVNLCLAVIGRRGDGYHDIDSVAATIDWHDLVGIRAEVASHTTVRVRVTGGAAPVDGSNLAVRAAHAVAALAGPLDVDLWLHKRLPAEAGLGGGSADAAAVLRGLQSLLAGPAHPRRAALDPTTLDSVAASLGSDVPMLLCGGVERMRGRGEVLDPISSPRLRLVVVHAGVSGTARTYTATRDFDHEDGVRVERVIAALAAGRTPEDGDLGSGLEAAACRAHPDLDERLTALRAAIPEVAWHLTGSGGSAFALCSHRETALELAGCARSLGMPARVCHTVTP